MKKLLLLSILLLSLVFLTVSSALAATISFDYMPGTWKVTGGGVDGSEDATSYVLNFDQTFNKYKVGFEYQATNLDPSGENSSLNGFELKGGYFFTDNLSATLSYLSQRVDASDMDITAFLLSLEGSYALNEKMKIGGVIGYSLSGTERESGSDTDINVLNAKCRFSYFFTEQLAGTLGYRYQKIDFDGGISATLSGPTLGITYQF
jgi:hypothetical protein